jgi:hypothetical protein
MVDKEVKEGLIGIVGNALQADVTSHYNPETNHCYAEVYATKNFSFKYPKTPDNFLSVALYDAQTRGMLMFAGRNGEKETGTDFTQEALGSSTYDQVLEKIDTLMKQD